MAALRSLLPLVLLGRQAFAYTWPNAQMEALDALRYEQAGRGGSQSATFTFPCEQFIEGSDMSAGRINSADWLRTAYHDMATHNATAGTGGLDASIQFQDEQARPENAGDSFSNTIGVVGGFAGPHVSLADAIAFGAVVAVESCGGDYIPFRGGRVDATQAGPPGVPEPQDTLTKHTADFARQGFTPNEMIQLIACGHSMGGVQHTAFPTISQTPGTVNNTSGNEFFDTTFDIFDNKIATDYISGKSINPLVVGPNITTRSDARIFASDGNVTMKALAASNTFFKATCSVLFSRMLNTVPRGVQLTEEVLPLPAKPAFLRLTRNLNGTISASTSVRFWNKQEDASRVVDFVWAGSNGHQAGSYTMMHDSSSDSFDVSTFIPGNVNSLWYNLPGAAAGFSSQSFFNQDDNGVPLSGDATKFWFEVTENGRKTVLDQDGAGFPLGDTTVLPAEGFCLLRIINSTSTSVSLLAQVGVVKGANPSSVSLEFFDRSTAPKSTLVPAVFNKTASASNRHINIWTATVDPSTLNTITSIDQGFFNVVAQIGGRAVSPNLFGVRYTDFPACPGSSTSF